jgi:hypothetical protein
LASQVVELLRGELEHEVFRESIRVALHGPNQRASLNAVERRQVGIEHHPMSTDLQNRLFDASQWNRESRLPVNGLLHTDVRRDAKRAKSSARPRGSLQLRGALQ